MDDFFLKPFLNILAAEGLRASISDYRRITLVLRTSGPWDLDKLRGVLAALLVKSPEQEELFQRHFDRFFQTLRIDEIVELRSPIHTPDSRESVLPPKNIINDEERAKIDPRRARLRYWSLAVFLALLVVITAGLYLIRPFITTTAPAAIPSPSVLPSASPTTITGDGSFFPVVVLIGLMLLTMLLLLLLLPRSRRKKLTPLERPAWRHFDFAAVGGKPAAFLDSTTLDHLAGLVSYVNGENTTDRLDLRVSVETTVRRGGLPALIYRKQKLLKTVHLLQDDLAESTTWNSVPQELTAGLALRGVPVVQTNFHDSLRRFETVDATARPDEIDTDFEQLLIFSDGKGVNNRSDKALRELARQSKPVWMELREPRFWDEKTDLIASNDIPIYPATNEGTLEVFSNLHTEPNPPTTYQLEDPSRHAARFRGSDLPFKLEHLLGDALPWAQACAMTQPLTLGMADSLRREFQPQLPPERMNRLFALPGTTYTNSGIRFSDPVLGVLRSGFSIRWDEEKQEEILEYILKEIGKAEPKERDSLAHLSWEWLMARVRLELDPSSAFNDVMRLMRTPLRKHIQAELEKLYLNDGSSQSQFETSHARIPVRRGTKGKSPDPGLVLLLKAYGSKDKETPRPAGARTNPEPRVAPETPKERARSNRALIGMLTGFVVGIVANALPASADERLNWIVDNFTGPIGALFLRLLLMMLVPLLLTSVVFSVASIGNLRNLARIGRKCVLYSLAISSISASIGLGLANIIKPGLRVGADPAAFQETYDRSVRGVLDEAQSANIASARLTTAIEAVVPKNVGAAAAGHENPQSLHLIFFALVLGVAVTLVSSRLKASVVQVAESLHEISLKVTEITMKAAPIAFACLIFNSIARLNAELLIVLSLFIVTVLLGFALQLFGVYSLSVFFLSHITPREFFGHIRPAMRTALSTGSSNATFPVALHISEEKLGVPPQINRFLLTVGSVGLQNGHTLYICATVLFLAQLAGINLSIGQQIIIALTAIITGIGITNTPVGLLPIVVTMLVPLGINPALISVIIGVDRLMDMFRVMLNVTGDITAATYVARSEGYELLTPRSTSNKDQR